MEKTQAECEGLAYRVGDVYVCWTPNTKGWWAHWVECVVEMGVPAMVAHRIDVGVPLTDVSAIDQKIATVWR